MNLLNLRSITIILTVTISFLFSTTRAESVKKLTPDNYYGTYNYVSHESLYEFYIKFSVILDSKNNPSTVWFQSGSHKYHADFLLTLPQFKGLSKLELDRITLYDKSRKVFIGTLFSLREHSTKPFNEREYHVELIGEDEIKANSVRSIFDFLIKSSPEFISKISYLPISNQKKYVESQSALFKALNINIVMNEPPNKSICYSSGWTLGFVKNISAAEFEKAWEQGLIDSNDILVMDELPRELPPFAGLIVSTPSSPSSHPVLLAEMSGSPFVYIKDAYKSEFWQNLETSKSPVFLKSSSQSSLYCKPFIQTSDRMYNEDVNRFLELKSVEPIHVSKWEPAPIAPVSLDKITHRSTLQFGAKASYVAELKRWIPNNTITKGLALSINLFDSALRKIQYNDKSLRDSIDEALKSIEPPTTPSNEIIRNLELIRGSIEHSDIPPDILNPILKQISEVFPKGTRIKLRSSSNAEDSPNFNGAGLYESTGACVGDDENKTEVSLCSGNIKKKTVSAALKKVWASFYSNKAYLVRRRYSINEQNVGMGVLIQASYKGELANGVLISEKYPYSVEPDQNVSITMTGFPGEDDSVTNPPSGKIPETTRVSPSSIDYVIPTTELPQGRKLLTENQYRELLSVAGKVHNMYMETLGIKDPSLKLDMEWKLIDENGSKKIIIKQVRPIPQVSDTFSKSESNILVGGKNIRMCPSSMEVPDGKAKLFIARPGYINLKSIKIPVHLPDVTKPLPISNPVESLIVQDLLNKNTTFLPTDGSNIYADKWAENGSSLTQTRSVTINLNVSNGLTKKTLQVSFLQQRSKEKLLSEINSITQVRFMVYQDVFGIERNWMMEANLNKDAKCEADLYSGFIPDFDPESILGRENPRPARLTYNGINNNFKIEVHGRTATQGFDKTWFIHIDKILIQNILSKPILTEDSSSALYAPNHHNMYDELIIDLYSSKDLSKNDIDLLSKKGLRYLLIKNKAYDEDVPGSHLHRELMGISEAGKEIKLGDLKLESQ